MSKYLNASQAPSAAGRRGARIRDLDASELAKVLGGTGKRPPDLNNDHHPGTSTKTTGGRSGFWRWLLG
jgi:hypothetical protein